MTEPIHVTDASFEQDVINSTIPVIVDFWAPWCVPCKMIAPALEKIAKAQAGKITIAKVNTDENPEWATNYGIQGIPTLLFFVGGEVVHEQVGVVPEPQLVDLVEKFVEMSSSAI